MIIRKGVSAGLALVTASTILGATVRSSVGTSDPCASAAPPARRGSSVAPSGSVPAEMEGDLVLAASDGFRAVVDEPVSAMVRHVAADPRWGVAYVRDLRGGDVVVAQTPTGWITRQRPEEAVNPSWSPDGSLVWAESSVLRIWSRHDGSLLPNAALRTIASPIAGATLFSPVFVSSGEIVAAVSNPPTADIPEGEYLSNLWRFDLPTSRWTQLTHFRADSDRWTVVRTPVVDPDGDVEFVRVTGRASATEAPSYELWTLHEGIVSRTRQLAGERYLAGSSAGDLLWNVPDEATATWTIEREDANGTAHIAGCGTALEDPFDVVDPDRATSPATGGAIYELS